MSGDLTKDELSKTLAKYADPDREVRSTESVVREAPAVVQPVVQYAPAVVRPVAQPVSQYAPVYVPQYQPQYRAAPAYYSSGST